MIDIDDAVRAIPVKNAWYLLLYAWDMAAWEHATRAEWDSAPGLLGLLARVLAFSMRDLMRRQLGRAFAARESLLHTIRGRVNFNASIKQLAFERAAAVCSYPELTIDTLKNRIIRSTLDRLVGDPRIASPDKPDAEAHLRQELRSLVQAMDGVTLTIVTPHDFSRLQLGQNDRGYRMPLAVCALIYRLGMPTESSDDTTFAELLKDEVAFHMLFERFVRNFYRMHLKGFGVEREWLKWHDELAGALVPIMKTDISIRQANPPHRRFIVDTKYSIQTLCENDGAQKFRAEHLYQIYAYLRTQDEVSEAHRRADGILVYPRVTHSVDAVMKVQGHRIRVVTINLASDWQVISQRLLATIPGPIDS